MKAEKESKCTIRRDWRNRYGTTMTYTIFNTYLRIQENCLCTTLGRRKNTICIYVYIISILFQACVCMCVCVKGNLKEIQQKNLTRASLVAQWLRICLLMQGTRVRALVWEDPTCHGATRPMSHNYWACASGACSPQQERPR